MKSWIANNRDDNDNEDLNASCQSIRHPERYQMLAPEESDDMIVSVKLFLKTFDDAKILEQAISPIMKEISINRIDSLILSLPDTFFAHEYLPKDLFFPLWNTIQNDEKVLSAGLADFDVKYLEQLCESIDNKKHLPVLNQVDLASCCVMPVDLVECCKQNGINLTTHVDPRGK